MLFSFFFNRKVTSKLTLLQMLSDSFLNPFQFFPERWSNFVFPGPILNHHYTVWWYPLYFKKLILIGFSKLGDDRKQGEKLER